MAGHLPSFTSYVITRAQPSLSSSPRLAESSEDSRNKVGMIRVIGSKMRERSYIQWIENRFTGSLKFSTLYGVVLNTALALEQKDYNYSEINLIKRMLDSATQTRVVIVPYMELSVTKMAIMRSLERVKNRRMMRRSSPV
jgi:hypothetical protein